MLLALPVHLRSLPRVGTSLETRKKRKPLVHGLESTCCSCPQEALHFSSPVSSLMSREEAQVAEAFSTLFTLIEPLGQVQPLVDAEALGPPEGLSALTTGVGLLPAVNPLVVGEVLFRPEGLAAVVAVERPLPGVNELVPQEV